MQSLAGSMRCCDRLLFYYTGHGMRMNAVKVTQGDASATWWCSKSKIAIGSGKGYICADDSGSGRLFKFPEDATMEDAPEQKDYWNVMMGDQPFWNEADPFSLGEWLSQINSCHMTAIVEACYSGGFQDPLLAQPGVRSVLVATGDDEPLESAPDKLGTENTAALLKGLATVDRSTATVDDVWVKAEQAAEANSYQDLDEDAASVKTNPCGCKCNPDGTRSRGRQKADGTEECADAPVETCSGDAYSCCYLTCAHAYSLACHPCEAFCEALSDAGVSGDCAAACAAWFNEQTFETCQEVPGLAESCPDPSCL
jgi:hypothetical protein